MSILHSSRAPWLMLIAFVFCAMTFFSLAVGRDVGLVAALFNPESPVTLKDEVQRLIARWGEKSDVAESGLTETDDQAWQKATLPPDSSSSFRSPVQPPAATAPLPVPPAPSPPAPPEKPGKILAHAFRQVEDGFEAAFHADRPVPRPKTFFIGEPARWVLDIPGDWRNMARFNNTIATGFIRQVVLGEHDGYLRIVFHFRNLDQRHPAQAPNIFFQDNDMTVTVSTPHEDG